MANTGAAVNLPADDMAALLSALEGSDSVELKVTVPDGDQRSAIQALDMDALDAQIRQVIYFDTPDLALNRHGVIVRARRTTAGDDSVIKLRPVVPQELSASLRKKAGFGVEVDAMPGGFVCSASLKAKKRAGKVKEVLKGEKPVSSLFSKEQRAFFDDCAPEGITLDELTVLGPITALKLKYSPPGYDRKLVAEVWFYPDGKRILELSTKCASTETFDVAIRTREFLREHGIDLTGEQQAKTRTALEYFSRELTKT